MSEQAKTFESVNDAEKDLKATAVEVKNLSIVDINHDRQSQNLHPHKVVVHLTAQEQPVSRLYRYNRTQLLDFAREVLRRYEPTTLEQIQDSLEQIKDILRGDRKARQKES